MAKAPNSGKRPADLVVLAAAAPVAIWVDGEELLVFRASDVTVSGSGGDVPPARTGAVASLSRLVDATADVQSVESETQRPALLKAMVLAGIDPVPTATVSQAQRLARHRERLLASGAFTIDALRQLRGDAKASSTRTWLSRRRATNDLFAVSHDGATLVPAFQLDSVAAPRPAIARILQVLTPADLGSWATWTWFTAPTPWLDGEVPVDLLDAEPARVEAVARRFVSNIV